MSAIKLSLRKNDEGNTKTLLKNNKIPGIIYGKKSSALPVFVESKEIYSLIKNRGSYSKILSINLNGENEKVLLKEVQFHPVSDNVIHIDFMRIQDNTKVTVEVPVNFLNREKCPGIKQGGVLNIVRRSIELKCNANKIPEILEFDLIESDIGDSIKISNINLPNEVNPTITDRDFVVATLVPPTVEAEPEKTEGEEDAEKAEGDAETKESESDTKKESKETAETKTEKDEKTDKKEK